MGILRINISKLSEGVHRYSLHATPKELGLGEHYTNMVEVQATLEKSVRQLFLSVHYSLVGQFTCDRCLDGFTKNLSGRYSVVFVMDKRDADGSGEEVQLLATDTNMIELDEDVRQYVELAIPQKLLCNDDCQGLCPSCGKNKNHEICSCEVKEVDSRWEALRKLSSN